MKRYGASKEKQGLRRRARKIKLERAGGEQREPGGRTSLLPKDPGDVQSKRVEINNVKKRKKTETLGKTKTQLGKGKKLEGGGTETVPPTGQVRYAQRRTAQYDNSDSTYEDQEKLLGNKKK